MFGQRSGGRARWARLEAGPRTENRGESKKQRGERLSAWQAGGAALLLSSLLLATRASPAPLTNMPQDYFPLGVFYQPAVAQGTTSFAGWKGRGINTLIGYENQNQTVSIDDYTAAAANAGLYLIRQPRDDPSQDSEWNIIGWLQPDEPENRGISADDLQATYNNLKSINPSRPILLNFDGSHIVSGFANFPWGLPRTQEQNAPYAAAADWLAQDVYPVTGWNYPQGIGVSGQATATLRQWYGKPTFAYIETSHQRLFTGSHPEWGERGPTAAEFRGEVWDAIIRGANGILYFSQSFAGFRYDATPIDVAAEMTKQNAAITGLAAALNSDDTPDVNALTFGTPGSLEYTIRSYGGVTYLIVLNLSPNGTSSSMIADSQTPIADLQVLGESRDLLPSDLNTFTDTFGPYGVHIYAESPFGFAPLAVPEPQSAGVIGGIVVLLMRCRGRSKHGRRQQRPSAI
jgi:hypothetical protein